jgi:mitochondrial fission process protein 1
MASGSNNEVKAKEGKDIWRDTGLRYMGYANECGEAFRPLYPKWVGPSYAVAFAYVFGDTGSKVQQSKRSGESLTTVAQVGADCLIWQTLASVLIPGYVINLVTKGGGKLVAKSTLPKAVRSFGPTAVGLVAIPLIIHPIDAGVHYFMDHTLRKFWPSK